MQNTHNIDQLASSLLDLVGFFNSPQRDDFLLREAGVDLDRALFPLLVRAANGRLGVGGLADLVGRDHTTVSRQLAKLEELGFIERPDSRVDRRRREVVLTESGRRTVRAITIARRRILTKVLDSWKETEKAALAKLARRFADAMIAAAQSSGET